MKALLITLFALTSFSIYAADWNSYIGCYETIQINGETIANPHGSQTTVEAGDAFWFHDVSKAKIPAINFFVFSGQDGDSGNYLYMPVFLDRGQRESLADGATAHFQGDVYFSPQDEVWSLDLNSILVEKSSVLMEVEQTGVLKTPSSTYHVGFKALIIKANCHQKTKKAWNLFGIPSF